MCSWCGVVGHITNTCYSKANGAARGGRASGSRGGRGGSSRGGRGGGYSRYGEGDGDEETSDQGLLKCLRERSAWLRVTEMEMKKSGCGIQV